MSIPMRLLWLISAIALGGCATSRTSLYDVAAVQNQAEALYAYSGAARFPLVSEVVEVHILRPGTGPPVPSEREIVQGGETTQTNRSASVTSSPGAAETQAASQLAEARASVQNNILSSASASGIRTEQPLESTNQSTTAEPALRQKNDASTVGVTRSLGKEKEEMLARQEAATREGSRITSSAQSGASEAGTSAPITIDTQAQ